MVIVLFLLILFPVQNFHLIMPGNPCCYSTRKPSGEVNLDQPRYDQNTYMGRVKHFFLITNPLNLFSSSTALENARCIVLKYK